MDECKNIGDLLNATKVASLINIWFTELAEVEGHTGEYLQQAVR